MDVRLIDRPDEFLHLAGSVLLEDEARHNLILGLATALRDHPALYPAHQLWVAEDDGRVIGAALRTPPHNLVLAQPRASGAIEALVSAVPGKLPGVVGALPEAQEFAAAWSAKVGVEASAHVAQGIYALSSVRIPHGVAGLPRLAEGGDRRLLVDWWQAFAVEALHEKDPDVGSIERSIDHRLGAAGWGLVLWEHGDEPVSLTGFGGMTPNGVRIGPVYTPPAHRGRGYASALVAAVSKDQIARGRRFCFLYTDLANSISNRIYKRIGYEWVCESVEIRFACEP